MSYSVPVCLQCAHTHTQTKGSTIRVDTRLPSHEPFNHINIRNAQNNSFWINYIPSVLTAPPHKDIFGTSLQKERRMLNALRQAPSSFRQQIKRRPSTMAVRLRRCCCCCRCEGLSAVFRCTRRDKRQGRPEGSAAYHHCWAVIS